MSRSAPHIMEPFDVKKLANAAENELLQISKI
jgi:hypothetical protein